MFSFSLEKINRKIYWRSRAQPCMVHKQQGLLQKGIMLPKACLKWVPPSISCCGELEHIASVSRRMNKVWAWVEAQVVTFLKGCGAEAAASARVVLGAGGDPCPPPPPAQLCRWGLSSSTLSALFLFWVNQLQTKMMCRKWIRPLEPGITMAWAVSPGYLLCIVYRNCAREKELFFSKWLLDTSCAAYQQPDLDPEMSVPAQSRQGSIIRDALATYFSTDGDNV